MTLCRIVWAAGLRAELGKMPPKRLQFVDCMHAHVYATPRLASHRCSQKNFEISSLCGIEPLPTKTGKQLNISLIWNQNKTLWRHIECFLSHFCRSTSKDFTASCYLFCNISLRGLWIKWGLFYSACGNRIVNLSSIKIQTLISWVQSWCEMVFWIESRIFF